MAANNGGPQGVPGLPLAPNPIRIERLVTRLNGQGGLNDFALELVGTIERQPYVGFPFGYYVPLALDIRRIVEERCPHLRDFRIVHYHAMQLGENGELRHVYYDEFGFRLPNPNPQWNGPDHFDFLPTVTSCRVIMFPPF